MDRRYFFKQLASGLIAAVAPTLFLPKLVKPQWKRAVIDSQTLSARELSWSIYLIDLPMKIDGAVIEEAAGRTLSEQIDVEIERMLTPEQTSALKSAQKQWSVRYDLQHIGALKKVIA